MQLFSYVFQFISIYLHFFSFTLIINEKKIAIQDKMEALKEIHPLPPPAGESSNFK